MDRHMAASLDHWLTTPPEEYGPRLYQVVVDGQPWKDADGLDSWPEAEAEEHAAHVEGLGYASVEIEEV